MPSRFSTCPCITLPPRLSARPCAAIAIRFCAYPRYAITLRCRSWPRPAVTGLYHSIQSHRNTLPIIACLCQGTAFHGFTLPQRFLSALFSAVAYLHTTTLCRHLAGPCAALPLRFHALPRLCVSVHLFALLCLYVSRPFTAVTNQSMSIPSLRRGSLRPCDSSRFRTAPWLFCSAVDFALADRFNTLPLPSITIRDLSTPSHVATILIFTAARHISSMP